MQCRVYPTNQQNAFSSSTKEGLTHVKTTELHQLSYHWSFIDQTPMSNSLYFQSMAEQMTFQRSFTSIQSFSKASYVYLMI